MHPIAAHPAAGSDRPLLRGIKLCRNGRHPRRHLECRDAPLPAGENHLEVDHGAPLMREPGFDEFADLWQDPDDDAQDMFEALARRARRQGRLLAYMDIALAVLLVGSTLFGAVLTPSPPAITA